MALDSPEMKEFARLMAKDFNVERVVLAPSLDKGWEFNKEGEIVKKDVPIGEIDTEPKSRKVHCSPASAVNESGEWHCILYNEENISLEEWQEQFPG